MDRDRAILAPLATTVVFGIGFVAVEGAGSFLRFRVFGLLYAPSH